MSKRGRILRDTNAGDGLVSVENQQYPFTLEKNWKSDLPPKTGSVVDVDFAADGSLSEVRAVAESVLAKEQAEVALAEIKGKGSAVAAAAVAKFGTANLVAIGVLIISWFFISTLSLNMATDVKVTFWQLLKAVNSGNPMIGLSAAVQGGGSGGIYSLLAILALVGPFVKFFWADKRAALAGFLPLALMLLVVIVIYVQINFSGGSSADGGDFSQLMNGFAQEASKEMMKSISLGVGTYLGFAASLYFAFIALKDYLVGRA